MKGQYLAVEAVLTFGMGLIIAVGTITMFNSYQQGLLDTASDQHKAAVASEVNEKLMHLKDADSAESTLNLPEEIGGSEYTLALDDEIIIFLDGGRYSYDIRGFEDYSMEGSVEGGQVNVFKSDNEFIIGAR